MSFGVLYISYDGMLEPLGKSQVLGYLNRLAVDRPIHLISFEKPSDWNNISELPFPSRSGKRSMRRSIYSHIRDSPHG